MLRILAMTAAAAGGLACADGSAPVQENPAVIPAATVRPAPVLTPQHSGTTNRLQAISPVNTQVAWASGVGGTYAITTNGGQTWRAAVVPGASALQFRDVEAVSAKVAYLMSAGPGDSSRVYKTTDGGKHWARQFTNHDPSAFYDCFAFWTPTRGLTMSDAVNGRFPVIRTTDGTHWRDIGDRLPPAQPGEAAFAASGTCVATQGTQLAWITTGGAPKARILATTDGGQSWKSYDTPIVQGTASSGGLSVDFRNARSGILGGGELAAPNEFSKNIAVSHDGGKHWVLATRTPFDGAVFGLSYVTHDAGTPGFGPRELRTVVATGPGGASFTRDEGESWTRLPGVKDFWAVGFAGPEAGWFVGTEGRILKISFDP